MSQDSAFAYAQVRIQARLSRLPSELEWRRLAPTRTLASFLEEARTGPLGEWVKGLSSRSLPHELELGVRSLFRVAVEDVTGWVPQPWRQAVSWTRWLVALPLLGHQRAGGRPPAWALDDPTLSALCDPAGVVQSSGAARQSSILLRGDDHILAIWTVEWRRRWPASSRASRRALTELEDLLWRHMKSFSEIAPEAAWPQRIALRERLRLRFRRFFLHPAVPFIYLALMALDLERLRAELLSRALFPVPEGSASTGPASGVAA